MSTDLNSIVIVVRATVVNYKLFLNIGSDNTETYMYLRNVDMSYSL